MDRAGDLHVHSNLSFDAYSFGNRTLTPADTLAFARGETLTATCIACHGPQGRSPNPMFPNLAGQHALYLARSLKSYRDGGRTSNPMLTLITEDLSDQDIQDIAAFYAAQSPNGEASP